MVMMVSFMAVAVQELLAGHGVVTGGQKVMVVKVPRVLLLLIGACNESCRFR
jgi:hypothetical protein